MKNDVRDAADLADLLRMGPLPEAWIAPPEVRELRELVRHRAKLVTVRSAFKAGVHAVLAKQGLHLPVGDLFGPAGRVELAAAPLDRAYRARVNAYLRLVDALDIEITPSRSPWPAGGSPPAWLRPGGGRLRRARVLVRVGRLAADGARRTGPGAVALGMRRRDLTPEPVGGACCAPTATDDRG